MSGRAAAYGRELVRVHDGLRADIADLRRRLTGGFESSTVGREITAYCLAFCAAVARHHAAEDEVAFPELGLRRPEMVPVLRELAHDHVIVADLLTQLRGVAERVGTAEPEVLLREIDGLAAVLESHFTWEERRLVEALDALAPETPVSEMLGVPKVAVLVEGNSDRAALLTLARRRGIEGLDVVVLGGITNLAKHLGRHETAIGLYDAAEERFVGGRPGFFRCDADLEDELIRAVGPEGVEAAIELNGELPSLRALQQQPAQRDRTLTQQLHRFMGSRSGRKEAYARMLAEVVPLAHVPAPLTQVIDLAKELS